MSPTNPKFEGCFGALKSMELDSGSITKAMLLKAIKELCPLIRNPNPNNANPNNANPNRFASTPHPDAT